MAEEKEVTKPIKVYESDKAFLEAVQDATGKSAMADVIRDLVNEVYGAEMQSQILNIQEQSLQETREQIRRLLGEDNEEGKSAAAA